VLGSPLHTEDFIRDAYLDAGLRPRLLGEWHDITGFDSRDFVGKVSIKTQLHMPVG